MARVRRARPSVAKGFRRLLRRAAIFLLILTAVAAGVYETLRIRSAAATRAVSVCVVTDFSFRIQNPSWEYQVKLWFAEVNRIFAPAAVRWEVAQGGNYHAMDTDGSLDARRAAMEETATCQADVVLGFTGAPDGDVKSSVSPFAHSVLLAVTRSDSDALMVTALARALAHLFAAPESTQTLITTDAPQEGVLDAGSLKLIERLRAYDLSKGIEALPGAWERRAAAALTEALAGKQPNPAAEAHRILGGAFAVGRMHSEAVAHFREAIRGAPRDPSLRLEMALELNADAQHDAAIAELRQASLLDPEDARPHAALGAILLNLRRAPEGIDELRTAVSLDPLNPDYQILLGQVLALRVGGAREARAAFQAAVRSRSGQKEAIHGQARLSAAAENMRDSLKRLEDEIRQRPASSDAHLRLGLGFAKAANVEAARTEIERSIQLDPRNGQARLAMAQLHFIEGDYAGADREIEAAKMAGAQPSQSFVSTLQRRLGRR